LSRKRRAQSTTGRVLSPTPPQSPSHRCAGTRTRPCASAPSISRWNLFAYEKSPGSRLRLQRHEKRLEEVSTADAAGRVGVSPAGPFWSRSARICLSNKKSNKYSNNSRKHRRVLESCATFKNEEINHPSVPLYMVAAAAQNAVCFSTGNQNPVASGENT